MIMRPPIRALMVGYPGTAKTGSLAALVNAGYKLRILDFDGNTDPLFQFVDEDKLGNISIIHLKDQMRMGAQFMEPVGTPQAFATGVRAMDKWVGTDVLGNAVDYGNSKDWGLDTILVVDSLTKMGDAAKLRAMKLLNKTPDTMTDRVWGLAMNEQAAFIEKLTEAGTGHHTLVIAHLKMVGPRDIRKGDSEITQAIKEQQANIIETRLYPSALGWALPQTIAADFPTVIEFAVQTKNNKVRRIIRSLPRAELDLKFPGRDLGELDIESGMLTVFKTLSPASFALAQQGNAPAEEKTI